MNDRASGDHVGKAMDAIRPPLGVLSRRPAGQFVALSVLLHGVVLLLPLAVGLAAAPPAPSLLVRLAKPPAVAGVSAAALRRPMVAAQENAVADHRSRPIALRRDEGPARPPAVLTPPSSDAAAPSAPSVAPAPPLSAEASPVVASAQSAPSVPTPAAAPAAGTDGAALAAYVRLLSGEVAKARRYPAVARLRGWQGTAVLTVELSPAGAVLASAVSRSSGHAVLDEQALRMLVAASPLPVAPQMPEFQQGRSLVIELPVVFTLAAS